MTCNCKDKEECKKAPEVYELGELPIDTLEGLPNYIIAEIDVENPQDGSIRRTLIRVPSEKLFPNGNYDNIIAIQGNNPTIEVPEGQVRGGYVANEGNQNIVYFADANHKAQFLILGTTPDGRLLIQNTGFVNTLVQHQYIIGANYYIGENGEPVTDPESGQKLFTPISETKLAVTL